MTEEPQAWKQSLEQLKATDKEYVAKRHLASAHTISAEAAEKIIIAGSNPPGRQWTFASAATIPYVSDEEASSQLGDYFKKSLEESKAQAVYAAQQLLIEGIEQLRSLEQELETADDEQNAFQIIKFRTDILEPLLEHYKALNE